MTQHNKPPLHGEPMSHDESLNAFLMTAESYAIALDNKYVTSSKKERELAFRRAYRDFREHLSTNDRESNS